MAQENPQEFHDNLDAMLDIATRIERARAAVPALRHIEPGEIIRHVPGKRAILEGQLDGRAVVLRLNLIPGDTALSRTWDEMLRLWPYMAEGDYRICEPLHYSPAHDLLVIEQVPGTPLLQYFWQTEGAARTRYLIPAAQWFRQASAMTEGWRVANAAGWLKRAERSSTRQPFDHLRKLEKRIIRQLRPLAARIEGEEWRVAICHGDLHPNNLIANDDRLTGIDFGGSSHSPIYKDMARFLMHMGRRCLIPSGDIWMGVDRMGAQAMIDAFQLSTFESEVILPFMLGVEALIRVEITELPPSRIKRAERMYRRLLRDLQGPDT